MSQPIVVDTNIVRALNNDTDEHAPSVTAWVRSLGGQGLCLPAPALVELIGETGEAAAETASTLMARYRLLPLDGRAAVIAGKLVASAGGIRVLVDDRIADDKSLSASKAKQFIRVDVMILACALGVNGKLFTTDGPLIKMAAKCGVGDRVANVPRVAEQTVLPGIVP